MTGLKPCRPALRRAAGLFAFGLKLANVLSDR
jgi:hypothetical protein